MKEGEDREKGWGVRFEENGKGRDVAKDKRRDVNRS